ncbi:Phosphatidylinositol 3-kinase catalytic subunit type 3 [Strongyloides ratti]|uniref:Chromatin modification-related protein MEAF6 n=1 Tax=Strongyloides ratti TaxID=34506 RepID=A0A090MXK2_STRRB|nr:Phosphatidylinositol 3-kinase catalytic subunit type 3 [Strongyloides ratti]CEF65579.1 Phosphatidylinositol 3-kinase catalytic subunit type 3 [Strongyloides ratti]
MVSKKKTTIIDNSKKKQDQLLKDLKKLEEQLYKYETELLAKELNCDPKDIPDNFRIYSGSSATYMKDQETIKSIHSAEGNELLQMIKRRRECIENLVNLENEITKLESKYFEESHDYGNMINGFHKMTSTSTSRGVNIRYDKRKKNVQTLDRIISLSSLTSPLSIKTSVAIPKNLMEQGSSNSNNPILLADGDNDSIRSMPINILDKLMQREFNYVLSNDLDIPLSINILSLECAKERSSYMRMYPNILNEITGQMFLKVSLFSNGRLVGTTMPTKYVTNTKESTSGKSESLSSGKIQTWNEWMKFPIKYSQLTRDAFVHFSVWDISSSDCKEIFIGETIMTLFSKRGTFRSDIIDLRLDPAKKGETKDNPWKMSPKNAFKLAKYPHGDEKMNELMKKSKMHLNGLMKRVHFLDKISLNEIEQIKADKKRKCNWLYLSIKLPTFTYDTNPFTLVFYQEEPILSHPFMPFVSAYVDPEQDLENLYESRHHEMTRNCQGDDRNLKPSAQMKHYLERIIKKPSCVPITSEERDLIWKFRYWLMKFPSALTKFVRCINWEIENEVKHAIKFINEWALCDAADALELLSDQFIHPFVRSYAVARLQEADDSIILLFLPQLVQSIRYEVNVFLILTSKDLNIEQTFEDHGLASFLVDKCTKNREIAILLYWYLKVEIEANERVDKAVSDLFKDVLDKMLLALDELGSTGREIKMTIEHQLKLVNGLENLGKNIADENGRLDYKRDLCIQRLSEDETFTKLHSLSLPLDPKVTVYGIIPEDTKLFSSKQMPMKLTFATNSHYLHEINSANDNYTLLYKRGDDLRQDQLVVQMIKVMDMLLKKEKLDLCLTPYSVLATSPTEGFVQFIKAYPFREVNNQGGIRAMLKKYRPAKTPEDIEIEALNNYTKSLAGYSIICYILGIGDRHMDNLLLCENGRDPKPFPPPMKLNSDIMNALGVENSDRRKMFVTYCYSAFCILRRNANLILNLFQLMLDAGIPDIAVEKDKAVEKVLHRFHLDLEDDEEKIYSKINSLINESTSDRFAAIMDVAHDFKQNYLN